MSTFTATIAITSDTLTVSRPANAPQAVDEVVDTLLYAVRDSSSPVTSVGITLVTDDTSPAPTPPPAEPLPAADTSADPKQVAGPLKN